MAIQNRIYVGAARRLIITFKLYFSLSRLTQYLNQYETNYRQYQTWQQFDYHAE